MTSQPSPRIVFFGNERLVSGLDHTDAPILSGLIECGYDVCAVVSHHTATRSRRQVPLQVATIAQQHDIPVFLPHKPTDITQELRDLQPDIGVLVAYGRIVPQAIIDIFPLGIVNIHPSLLPHYRGPTPIETPIYDRDTTTGVSIMQLTSGMDSGPVYAQRSVSLDHTETKFSLCTQLSALSTELFFEIFPNIVSGELTPTPQNDADATYCQLLTKADGQLDLTAMTALQADAHIRAYLGFPGSRITLAGTECIITQAHITPDLGTPGSFTARGTELLLHATDGSLSVATLKPAGKKEMPIQAFLAGYKQKL